MFQCPNCRAYTDLSAEVDDTNDFEEEEEENEPQKGVAEVEEHEELGQEQDHSAPPPSGLQPSTAADSEARRPTGDSAIQDFSREADLAFNVQGLRLNDGNHISIGPSTRSANVDIPRPRHRQSSAQQQPRAYPGLDNPLTLLNDSGPLAFDGRAGVAATQDRRNII